MANAALTGVPTGIREAGFGACVSLPGGVFQGGCLATAPTAATASASMVGGAAQASTSGVLSPFDPITFGASGAVTINSRIGQIDSSSQDLLGYFQDSAVNQFTMRPAINLTLAGVTDMRVIVSAGVMEQAVAYLPNAPVPLTNQRQLEFSVQLSRGDSSFIMDPNRQSMQLSSSPEASGQMELRFFDATLGANGTTYFLRYSFVGGKVTDSYNTLGLALPGLGADAAFAVHLGSLSTSFMNLDTPMVSYAQAFGDANITFATPEPEPLRLFGFGLLALALCARSSKSITCRNPATRLFTNK